MTASLPRGDDNAERLFAAVGHAISVWESLELQLAILHSIFTGRPRQVGALQEYGSANPTFRFRLAAVETAAATYFTAHPDQNHEGNLTAVIAGVRSVAIERHRIAHGIVTALPSVDPADADSEGWVQLGQRFRYFLGAPWYSTERLEMAFIELDSEGIDNHAQTFAAIRDKAVTLAQILAPEA